MKNERTYRWADPAEILEAGQGRSGMDLLRLMAEGTLDHLRGYGVKVGGVTQGERGLLWYEGAAAARRLAAIKVPGDRVIDTNGAGDLFHGAYVYARLSRPQQSWDFCFRFARAASAYGVQFLGNEARLPRVDDVFATAKAAGDALTQA